VRTLDEKNLDIISTVCKEDPGEARILQTARESAMRRAAARAAKAAAAAAAAAARGATKGARRRRAAVLAAAAAARGAEEAAVRAAEAPALAPWDTQSDAALTPQPQQQLQQEQQGREQDQQQEQQQDQQQEQQWERGPAAPGKPRGRGLEGAPAPTVGVSLQAWRAERRRVLQVMTKAQLEKVCARRGIEWQHLARARGGAGRQQERGQTTKAAMVEAILEFDSLDLSAVLT
jgi:hypothetical protein